MSFDDKFPPSAFLKRTLFRSPGRFLLYVFGFVALELVCGNYFPHQTAMVATYLLCIWIPVAFGLLVWQVIWDIKHRKDDQ